MKVEFNPTEYCTPLKPHCDPNATPQNIQVQHH